MCTRKSPIVQAFMLMRTWSVHSSGRLVKHVNSSSGITCGVLTLDTFRSITAGIHATGACLTFLVTGATSGIREL